MSSDGETGSSSEEVSVKEVYRFSRETFDSFNCSNEGRGLIRRFFFFSLFYMWPYQTVIQMQSFLEAEFPGEANSAGFIITICATWPMLLTHSILSFSGLSRRMTYAVKVVAPSLVFFALAVYLIVALQFSKDASFLLYSLYTVALVQSVAESFIEPAVYDMAGLLPSTLTSQSVQAGNGACGLVVSCVQIAARLLSNGLGRIGKDQLNLLTKIFLALMGATSLSNIAIYMQVRRSGYYRDYVRQKPGKDINKDTCSGAIEESSSDEGGEGSVWRATVKAIRYVWPSFLAISLVFATSLTLWPVIPGRGCASAPGESDTLQSWWFDIVIFTFNFSDFLGKSAKDSLQWGSDLLTPKMQLLLAFLRACVFVPAVLMSSAPQLYPAVYARWVLLVTIILLGFSNGWLSTVAFMRAPKALPAGTSNAVAEQASTVLVIGLFLGISSGCLIAYGLGQTVLSNSMGQCFSS